MKPKSDGDGYEEDPFGLGKDFEFGKTLTRAEEKALGLPSPEKIARSLRTRKVTLLLDEESIQFFKEQAEEHDVPYQAMIRGALRNFVMSHRQQTC